MFTPADRAALHIMPPQEGSGPLDIVIAIMAFLATLALGAALIAGHAADSWRAGLEGKLTIQIVPPDTDLSRTALKNETDKVLALLRATHGISWARPLSEKEERALVKPWIGADESLEDLPLPQLIDADLAAGVPPDMAALRQNLKEIAPDARLDDHSYWMGRLQHLARSVIWTAQGILALIAIALVAVVAFATQARLNAHHDMVALLHQMGAQAGYIARTFEGAYFRAAFIAGAAGMACGMAAFVSLGWLARQGAAAVPFLPPLHLVPLDYLWLITIPVISGLIGQFTARIRVWAVLARAY